MKTAKQICETAAGLVGGDRAASHGDKTENHRNIATLWNAYLGWRLGEGCLLKPDDVALMMLLLKVARTKTGTFNEDDFVDMAGYAGCAAEIAGLEDAKDKMGIGRPLGPLTVPQTASTPKIKIKLEDFRDKTRPISDYLRTKTDVDVEGLRDLAAKKYWQAVSHD